MLTSTRLEIRASEIRTKLNELAGAESLTDEQRTEVDALTQEYADNQVRYRAALVSEDTQESTVETPDAEERERRELRGKARVSDFLASALTGRPVAGASAEYADAVGCPGRVPLDLLDTPEERAVTPGPASETVTSTRPTVPAAFARTDAAALGISMPMVAPGEAHYPALTTAPPAGPKAKDAAADSTAAAFSLTKRTPGPYHRPVPGADRGHGAVPVHGIGPAHRNQRRHGRQPGRPGNRRQRGRGQPVGAVPPGHGRGDCRGRGNLRDWRVALRGPGGRQARRRLGATSGR